jgi:hypothetical protein
MTKKTTFEEAIAQHHALDEENMHFPFNPLQYRSVKDTVPERDQDKVCPVCHFPRWQHGWIRMDWPIGHPLFGQAIQCPRCGT